MEVVVGMEVVMVVEMLLVAVGVAVVMVVEVLVVVVGNADGRGGGHGG